MIGIFHINYIFFIPCFRPIIFSRLRGHEVFICDCEIYNLCGRPCIIEVLLCVIFISVLYNVTCVWGYETFLPYTWKIREVLAIECFILFYVAQRIRDFRLWTRESMSLTSPLMGVILEPVMRIYVDRWRQLSSIEDEETEDFFVFVQVCTNPYLPLR